MPVARTALARMALRSRGARGVALAAALALVVLPLGLAACGGSRAPASGVGTISIDLNRQLNRFSGVDPLGAGLDGRGQGEISQIYTPANLAAMRSVGLGPLTYRLRTELGSEAWHWNPRGHWSDASGHRGYWTSADHGPSYPVSYGYRLPRRGNTIDQANNDGYSRLDDGDTHSFWKSNPYLDPHFTAQGEAQHPQWVMVDLVRPHPVDGAKLDWAAPYAKRVRVQHWVGQRPPVRYGAERENAAFSTGPDTGSWQDFPRGEIAGHGGRQSIRLASRPLAVRWVRVLMSASSHTAPRSSRDLRDRLGFAMRELHVGLLRHGHLEDFVRQGASSAGQSVVWVSSTDPWHRASDRDPGVEQPSFDTVFASGLGHGRPVLMPIALPYGTPEDAAAEVRFLHGRGYPVRQIEMGEEPDGQLLGPEDYGALYAQFALALHRADPALELGGPGLSSAVPDWTVPPDGHSSRSWTARLLAELAAHRAGAELRFFSFEWYPFDDVCVPAAGQLTQAPALLSQLLARQRLAGLPAGLPVLITEYGYSPFAAEAELGLAGALIDADIAGTFLSLGGTTAYLYGYEPDAPIRESPHCPTYGNLTLFQSDDQHRILHPTAAYLGMRMLGQQWLSPAAGVERLYAASSDVRDGAGRSLVSAYAVGRQDGRLALMLINKDAAHAHTVTVRLARGSRGSPLQGKVDLYQLSRAQYAWHAARAHGYPRPDAAPRHTIAGSGGALQLSLPASSLSVARTRGPVLGRG